jgi:hypothetical protein
VDNECRKVWGDLGIGFTSGRWLILCRVAAYLNLSFKRDRESRATFGSYPFTGILGFFPYAFDHRFPAA